MADLNRPAASTSFLEEPRKIPDMINVLTILTFIGCAVFSLWSIYGCATAPKAYETLQEAQGRLDQAPAFAKKFMGPEMVEMARKAAENRVPIFLLGLVGFALCAYGAVQMRQLKKTGFYFYIIGELPIPLLSAFLFLGGSAFSGTLSIFGYLIPVVFIVLYATQLKYLR